MKAFFARPLDVQDAKEIGRWIEANFAFQGSKTPKGQKALKEEIKKLHWWLAYGSSQTLDMEKSRPTYEAAWANVESHLDDLVRYFSEEGGVSIPKEIKIGSNTYRNISGFNEATLRKYAERVESAFAAIKGWRRKALAGGVTVALAGPGDFNGTAAGKYKSDQDTLYVRATPKILGRSGNTYGSVEYIIVHEMGHRYERKVHMPDEDFDKQHWWTSKYSRKEGEGFAELYGISNFGYVGAHYGDPNVVKRFEALMEGRDDAVRPELPEHLKRFRQPAPTWT